MIPILGKIADKLGFSFLNRRDSPSNNIEISNSPKSPVIQTGRVEGGVHQTNVYGEIPRTRPSLDIRTNGASGGPDGNSISFVIRNDGQESARNIKAQLMDGEQMIKEEAFTNLIVGEAVQATYDYTNTAFFLKKLLEPRLVLTYNAIDGRRFRSGANLIQEDRADGRFNLSVKLGDSFDEAV